MRWRGALVRFSALSCRPACGAGSTALRPEPGDGHRYRHPPRYVSTNSTSRRRQKTATSFLLPAARTALPALWVMGRADRQRPQGCSRRLGHRAARSDRRTRGSSNIACAFRPRTIAVGCRARSPNARWPTGCRPQCSNEQKKGYQGADWHEGLTAARGEAAPR